MTLSATSSGYPIHRGLIAIGGDSILPHFTGVSDLTESHYIPAKRRISSPTAPAFPLQHRGIHKNRLSVGGEAVSSAVQAGAESSIHRRAASLAWGLQISAHLASTHTVLSERKR